MLGLQGDNVGLDFDAVLSAMQHDDSDLTRDIHKSIRKCETEQPYAYDIISRILKAHPTTNESELQTELAAGYGAQSTQRISVEESAGNLPNNSPSQTQEITRNAAIEASLQTINSVCKNIPAPDLDDQKFFDSRAEFDLEPFSLFNLFDQELNIRYDNLEGFQNQEVALDLMLSTVKNSKLARFQERAKSFKDLDWSRNSNVTAPS